MTPMFGKNISLTLKILTQIGRVNNPNRGYDNMVILLLIICYVIIDNMLC